jgi:DNA-directed RNA polymerase beta subunit
MAAIVRRAYPGAGLPESFYVLIKELQSLGLDVELIERKNGKERVIGLERISSAR